MIQTLNLNLLTGLSLTVLLGCSHAPKNSEPQQLNNDLGHKPCNTDVNIQRDLSSDAGYGGVQQHYLDDTGAVCIL
ncbi:hypothetical protein OAM69_03895 [bacterium]|nr:hypothetical protein [bacterium]